MKTSALRHSRRRFLQQSAAAAAAITVPYYVPASVLGADAPSNRINVAVIGTGNQGYPLMVGSFLPYKDVQVLAVCDVNKGSYGYKAPRDLRGREPAQRRVNEHYAAQREAGQYKGCDAYADFRDVLARDDIDAVVVAVPDHWHGLITVMAARAGKDIYCEKPLSLTIDEGRRMVEAVRKHKRILQTGSHERSSKTSRFACELVRNGRIGEVKRVETLVGFHNMVGPGPGWKPMPVPEGFDYDMWLGPAPELAYHKDRCLYRFRFHYDYSGGQVTNFGAHSNDLAQWGLGMDDTGPVEVQYLDAKFLPEGSLFNAATETKFRCRYANGVELTCVTDRAAVGARFEGTEGVVEIGYGKGLITEPASLATSKIGPNEIHLYRSVNQGRNFIDCVKSRAEPVAPVEVGHRSSTVCHLGNIAVRLGKKDKVLKWDPERERFTNDEEANRYLTRPLREPWSEEMT